MAVEITKLQKVVDRVGGFNEVEAWITENDELVISLSHRNTNDHDVLIRVRGDDDVILVDEATAEWEKARTEDFFNGHLIHDGPWEDRSTQLGRLNTGGNWE